MSYEPTLIIRSQDLRNLEEVLGNQVDNYNSTFFLEEILVAEYLRKVLHYELIEFEDSSFYICQPELTSFNADVREFLDEYEVYYKIYN